jgi:hypothetical protein
MKINESDKRRPDFLGGVPVTMADGQAWSVPKPRARFAPSARDGVRAVLRFDDGDDYQDLLDRLDDAEAALVAGRGDADLTDDGGGGGATVEADASDGVTDAMREVCVAELALFRALLLRNYDLTDRELSRVLQVSWDEEGDPAGYALYASLKDLARGRAPKPQAGGTGSA